MEKRKRFGGTVEGAAKTAAKRIGVALEVYVAQRAAGRRWCGLCRSWLAMEAFSVDRRRPGGTHSQCRTCSSLAKRASKARCRARRGDW